ncbi:cysteine-rich repeat secretory protein 38-like [Populus alba x Populus x berolinensis]|uniref:Cysteine-rich repeat secretory protein 38-like n=1 Tax=Populus alba x Populus x berolinensis TaxID=444605 RepID=A0AAD6QIZ5_9ROSI|nr:cysteine-rich repeat secretory protein 38-like [Populus alba x Populus x berolinensis]
MNYTSGSAYQQNLNLTLTSLAANASLTGHYISTVGQNPNLVYGLINCPGDASTSDCKTCVVEAGSEIRKRCPYNKAAIIWYDNCLFKYSNKEFFGQIDNGNKFYMRNVKVVSEPVTFNGKTKELLTQLANKVQATPKLYKTGEMELGESTKLYGLVQCTRDLSSAVCKKCLDGIIGELPSCCDGKEGGRVVSGSCNFRYEIYPFVNA